MITIKKKIKKTLKNRPFLFFIAKTILNILNLKKNNLFNVSMVTYENHWFHPGVTFAIHDSALKINKTTNGLWILK